MLRALLILLAAAAAQAAPLDEGKAAEDAGRLEDAARLYRQAAEAGDADAQCRLGGLLARGQDFAGAMSWYRKAAEQGVPKAQFDVAALYANGKGVARDNAAAFLWFSKAAEAGLWQAQAQLASFYEAGRGVARDPVLAYKWYALAAQERPELSGNLVRLRSGMDVGQLAAAQALLKPAPPKPRSQPPSALLKTESNLPAQGKPAQVPPAVPGVLLKIGGVGVVLGAGAFGAFLLAERKGAKRLAAPPAPAPAKLPAPDKNFRCLDYQALLAAEKDLDQCERIAHYYGDAGRTQDFINQNRGHKPSFYTAYAFGFMKAGHLRAAMALIQMKAPPDPEDADLCAALRDRLTEAQEPSGGGLGERLALALAFSRRKLHAQALSLLDDETLAQAAAGDAAAYSAARVFHEAKVSAEFARSRTEAKPAEFLRAYAAAFGALNEHAAALSLLKQKRKIEPEDYGLYVSLERALGLHDLGRDKVPEAHRVFFAQALMDAGEDEEALAALLEGRRAPLAKEDYAAALRLCQRLERFETVCELFARVEKSLPASEAPELYYYFAIFCEKRGELKRAREVYALLTSEVGQYKDVERRIGLLASVPAEEEKRITTSSALFGKGSPAGRAPEPGDVLGGKFELQKPLGVGGMGVVYKGWDQVLSREVAVKKMRPEISRDKLARRLFLEEARLVAALNHPYIVSIHEIVSAGDDLYLVFEYVDGETLAEILAARGALPPRECVRILRLAGEALAYAHENSVVHQDLKPGNIMMTKRGYVKVMDFGLARHAGAGAASPLGAAGTPAYMPPEQHRGEFSPRCDIYSLGATAYELLSGRAPFDDKDLLARKEREEFLPLPPEVPASLSALIASCLMADPERRPRAVSDVLEWLGSAA